MMILKIGFGIYGHSDALVADGVHSVSDFATDLIVLAFVSVAYKEADAEHPYGHGKFETLASLLIAAALLCVGIGICYEGITAITRFAGGEQLPHPSGIVIWIAALSIVAKEVLYRITISAGRRIRSSLLQANAWHHRTDAFSSVATMVGASAAYFLGESWRVCDPVASIIISVMIAWSAIGIARSALDDLLERSLPPSVVERMSRIIDSTPGVICHHHLRTRHNGRSVIIDVHIKVDPDISVSDGHDIATDVERRLGEEMGVPTMTYVHVEPMR
ncbi:MAG: cation diffusion facilitator family transporter [Muribaculaceae bacterium]|nr:cation diffusion facilitator family transporter [Muribaculaceae bacterium]